jgi:hypothetical protein
VPEIFYYIFTPTYGVMAYTNNFSPTCRESNLPCEAMAHSHKLFIFELSIQVSKKISFCDDGSLVVFGLKGVVYYCDFRYTA